MVPMTPYDPAITIQNPVIMYGVSANPFEYPPGSPGYIWFYKDPKGNSQGPFN